MVVDQAELEAVMDELSTNPIATDEEIRTYSILKMDNGTIEVRRGLGPNHGGNGSTTPENADRNLERDDNEDNGVSKQDSGTRDQDLTKKGNDPQTSDQAPRSGDTKYDIETEQSHVDQNEGWGILKVLENDGATQISKADKQNLSIKGEDRTYIDNPSPSTLPTPKTATQTSSNTDSKINGRGTDSWSAAELTTSPQSQDNPAREADPPRSGRRPDSPVQVERPSRRRAVPTGSPASRRPKPGHDGSGSPDPCPRGYVAPRRALLLRVRRDGRRRRGRLSVPIRTPGTGLCPPLRLKLGGSQ